MILTEQEQALRCQLSPAYPWKDHFCWLDQVGSTNDYLKQAAREGAPEGSVVLTEQQTNGHGRMGRTFLSPSGSGVYLSVLLRPQCKPTELLHLTCAVGVAMCDAVENATGFRPSIKWTNDLVAGKRKLGGILTEMGLSTQGEVSFAIAGIGINCTQEPEDFPPEIRSVATSLRMITGEEVSRERLAAAMMESLARMSHTLLTQKSSMLARYRKDCITLGKEISLVRGQEIRRGVALDIDEDGALIVELPDGTRQIVNSGEVSIRGMYGYV